MINAVVWGMMCVLVLIYVGFEVRIAMTEPFAMVVTL